MSASQILGTLPDTYLAELELDHDELRKLAAVAAATGQHTAADQLYEILAELATEVTR